ncbi:MAG TPA: hypothetical protein VJ576_01245 [Rhodocyclaceae bacterium]|nr:hypothetical protein [Rhodocyclaceae bacterium]
MTCSVYCLVRRPEQLDPLVDRLQDAGVGTEDIAVVLRKGTEMFSYNFTEASRFVQAFWDLSVNSAAALWWPLVMFGWTARGQDASDHAVIPLDLYRAKARTKE